MLNRFRLEEGWTTVWLLMAVYAVAGMAITAAGWTPELWVAAFAAPIGVIAGLALAKSRFHGLVASIFALVYGVFVVAEMLIATLDGDWHYRTVVFAIRLNNFLYYALNGGTSRDLLPFPFFIGLIFWFLAVLGAWSIFRQRSVWLAIVPAGVAVLVNAYFYVTGSLEGYLAAYLILALLLLTRVTLLNRETNWRERRLRVPPDTRREFLRAGLFTALGIVATAWLAQAVTPAVAQPQAVAVWNRVNGSFSVVRENFERLFSSVRNPGLRSDDFYGDTLQLGRASSLSDRHLFDVEMQLVDPSLPEIEQLELAPIPRFYWRSLAYMVYEGGQWSLSDETEFREFDQTAVSVGRLPSARLRREVTAIFHTRQESASRLVILPQVRAIDRDASFQGLVTPTGQIDTVAVRASTMLQGDDRTYRVVASVSVADAASLRGAGQSYPRWVTDVYLQVPDTITERTRRLAREIVDSASASNPFDQAQAVTNWLRTNIAYDLSIDAAPDGAEPIDWFLFELRRGYCNNYASAAVILLRSLGIPARMAVGFTQGERQQDTGFYRVIERNAHAWPEVYFPDYGWVEFEPTSAEPELVRPERSTRTLDDSEVPAIPIPDPLEPRPEPTEVPTVQQLPQALAINWAEAASALGRFLGMTALLALVVAVIGGGALLRNGLIGLESLGGFGQQLMRWLGRSVPSPVAQAYLQLERAGRWLGLQPQPDITPREQATAVCTRLPAVRPEATAIANQYMTEQYSQRPELANGRVAQTAWRRMRLRVWRAGITRWAGNLTARVRRAWPF
jgi:transglutaminase-like putative cysteine protease